MNKTIKVIKKSIYGRDLVYIVSEHAESINQLTGKQTIDDQNIEALKKLGYDFEVQAPDL